VNAAHAAFDAEVSRIVAEQAPEETISAEEAEELRAIGEAIGSADLGRPALPEASAWAASVQVERMPGVYTPAAQEARKQYLGHGRAVVLVPFRGDVQGPEVAPEQPAEPWAYRGAASSSASRGRVLHSADAELSPAGAREVARRLLQAADDAERQQREGLGR
jgi:hypothetical protein